jgi:acyl-CoA synthetase (AMP-forming)/AMP-acid ligase II
MPPANIARHLSLMAAHQPNQVALKVPRGRTAAGEIDYLALTFSELENEVDAWVERLRSSGVEAGDRVLVMVKPGLPLIAAAFALFKHGAVPVIIDPGMGLKSFLSCVRRSRPRALLGIPLARVISRLFRPSFRSVEIRVAASASPVARIADAPASAPLPARACGEQDLAAILFTSGSTGAPKGVCYEHGMFEAQVRLIRATYAIEPGEIDLPMLPIFALFNPALGMTTIVPEINPSRPATVDPEKIVRAILQENVTTSFGSPTLWNKLADYCIEKNITLPSMRRVLCAGAPVPLELWEKSRRFLSNGLLHSPYGATEALPVSSISATEIFAVNPEPARSRETRNLGNQSELGRNQVRSRGACVGFPVREIDVRVIVPVEGPIATFAETQPRAAEEIGEIIVHGPVVTKNYDGLSDATAAAKIAAEDGSCWHRMGDTGFFDREGRLWFTGRKVESVEMAEGVLFTEPVEQVFRVDEAVARCALIGLGERPRQTPALAVQLKNPNQSESELRRIAARLRALACADAQARVITRFFFHPRFPVDVRHNAKIHRLTLARWAATQQPIEVNP